MRRLLLVPLIVLAVLGSAPFLILLALDILERRRFPLRPDPIAFEASGWSTDDETRLAMLDDLIASRVLIGRTREEVTSLLGHGLAAEQVSSSEIGQSPGKWDLSFRVGCRDLSSRWLDPYGIDCSDVVVRFGAEGRVTEVGVVSR